ncbi:MAG TPA: HAMP domain-containing sensor histidine kinase [Bacteroidales bacterium]|nr:HAMP domain-containing sensor histidine kinase [Bacteroidales bacterium]
MRELSYSKRIAFNFMFATALLVIVIYLSISLVVFRTVYSHLNDDLYAEYEEIKNSIVIIDGKIIFANPAEWTENEHGQIEVNPTFIQVSDSSGKVIRRSSNLFGTSLELVKNRRKKDFFNTRLSSGMVRQLQMTLNDELNNKAGYISVAIPLDESRMVLKNLFITLVISFPVVLLFLYFITRIIAQKSIAPVKALTHTAEKITRENLTERIDLPENKDELFLLTATINRLLDRIEETIIREKQFSSDASHELRTPLSVLKGTLELMNRKPRDPAYYVEKTNTCIYEVNRMSVLVDQLLLLARYEKAIDPSQLTRVSPGDIINKIIARHASSIDEKSISLFLNIDESLRVLTDEIMVEQIIENLFNNALKYSYPNSTIGIFSTRVAQDVLLTVKDEGIGMTQKEIALIFNRFFRADESRNNNVRGYGLGLSIAKRFADLLNIEIRVESIPNKGSSFTLVFKDLTA